MKIYISADIEGVTGVTHWDETDITKPDNAEFREQMTAEVAAACESALAAGATEIWIKDAHASARNIQARKLPQQARLIRGWSGHPFVMMQELDETFAAVILIGYHSGAGTAANPLAHTCTGRAARIRINGIRASEFLINAYTAALAGVPVVFVAGDAGLCDEITEINPQIHTLAVKSGIGDSAVNIHPDLAVQQIRDGVSKALAGDLTNCRIELPAGFSVEVRYKNHFDAYKASFYPGASLAGPSEVLFEADNYFDVLRFIMFTF